MLQHTKKREQAKQRGQTKRGRENSRDNGTMPEGRQHEQQSLPETASVVQWSEFLGTDPEVPGSIPGATRFSEK
jgi:hypothetical protein